MVRRVPVKRKEKWSRIFLIAVTVLLFLLLVFFTLFGDAVYKRITPEVTVQKFNMVEMDGKRYACIPKEALTKERCIYLVTSEQGFSRVIYRIWKYQVESVENASDPAFCLIPMEKRQEKSSGLVVVKPEEAADLKEEEKVQLKR